ncbi:MAG: tetratricopeptide repeat protein [Promethearchaeota archaeon]
MILTMEQQVAVLLPHVRANPDDEDSWKKLRRCVSKMSDMDGLEDDFRLLTEEFPKVYLAWQIHANSLLVQKRTEEAISAIERALALYGNDSRTWHLYGSILNIAGRRKAAIKAHKKAIQLNKNDPEIWLSLSFALIKCRRVIEAQKAINRLVNLNPTMAIVVLEHLIKIQGESQ